MKTQSKKPPVRILANPGWRRIAAAIMVTLGVIKLGHSETVPISGGTIFPNNHWGTSVVVPGAGVTLHFFDWIFDSENPSLHCTFHVDFSTSVLVDKLTGNPVVIPVGTELQADMGNDCEWQQDYDYVDSGWWGAGAFGFRVPQGPGEYCYGYAHLIGNWVGGGLYEIEPETPLTVVEVPVPPPASWTHHVTVVPPANGRIEGTYEEIPGDAHWSVWATPDPGYRFSMWTHDASGRTDATLWGFEGTLGALFVEDTTDSDGDGLSAYLEAVVYGTNPERADTDGDGFDDGFEVGNGFNPNLASSTPERLAMIKMIPSSSPAAVEFRFNAASGVSYRIEAASDLSEWTTIETDIIGQGAVVTRDYSIENQPQRYFRAARN